MPQKRIFLDGASYFVTTRTHNNEKIFTNHQACQLFLEVLNYSHQKLNFELFAFVVLPNHVHLLIRPNRKNTISDTMRHIKGRFANKYKEITLTEAEKFILGRSAEDKFLCYGRAEKSNQSPHVAEKFILGKPVWQKSFHDRIIRSDEELFNKLEYIDQNAAKHRIVDDPIDWLYSSYHNHHNTGKEIINIDYLE